MAYRKRTLRSMSPVARKLARLIGELDSISRRTKNLIEEIQLLEADSRALQRAKQLTLQSIVKNENLTWE